jgi:hypothetical protein
MGTEEIKMGKDTKIKAETRHRGMSKKGRDGKKLRRNEHT